MTISATKFHPAGRFLAWDKLAGLQPWDSFCDVEYAWHSRTGAARLISHRWKGLLMDGAGGESKRKEHSMQKPIRVMAMVHRAMPA